MINRWWQRRREARALKRRAIADDLWLGTLQRYRFLACRPMDDLLALRRMVSLFLDTKEFTATADGLLTDCAAVAIAAQACLPVLKLEGGLDWYSSFIGIVLQPDEVVAQREWMDEDGIVHTGNEVLAGETMPGGPLMLSWPDVEEGAWGRETGYNVVIHEFAHVIDMRDGLEADGVPPLPSTHARRRWAETLGADLARLQRAVDRGAHTDLDPYGANGPEEFFAVASEAFFVSPHRLARQHAGTYALLKDFYRQDTLPHLR